LHSARSTTFWLLLSLGAVFALLAWSAQRRPQPRPPMQAAFEDCQAAHPAMSDLKACIQNVPSGIPAQSFP
jgi:hypothetical protein